jgi:hypothetical protein
MNPPDGSMRDELLNGEIFHSVTEVRNRLALGVLSFALSRR